MFFGAIFCIEQLQCVVETFLACFYAFLIFDDFARSSAFAGWPIFKMGSFFEYLVFFGAVFCRVQLLTICGVDLDMFFEF